MVNKTASTSDEPRMSQGQSLPPGDTGDGNTGVPDGEQGISNRPGDSADDETNEDDQTDQEESEVTDPAAEPGKPV